MNIKKISIWKADWFIGLLVVFIFLFISNSDLMQSLERKAYDLGLRSTSRVPSDKVAVIAIDDRSIANLGRWPWPRSIQAEMLDLLTASHAKVIGNTVLFFEPQVDPGMEYLSRIQSMLDSPALKSGSPALQSELSQLRDLSSEAVNHLDNDKKLSISILNANNVMLPMYFELGEQLGKLDKPLADYVQKNNLTNVANANGANRSSLFTAVSVQVPIPVLGSGAAGIGHMNTLLDVDGGVRTEPLVISYYDQLYPSLPLLLAAKSLNLDIKDITVTLGKGVKLGNLSILTDDSLRMHTFFYKDRDGLPAFPVDSFYDVLTGKIPAEKYRDKIVLIGATAAGVGTSMVTPVSANMPSVMLLAHSISSILKQDFFVIPDWSGKAQIGIFIAIALYIILLLPRLGAGLGAVITSVLFVSMLGTHFYLMLSQALWLPMMVSASMLLIGHLVLTSKHFFRTEKGKIKADADSAESNRMLGLAFQGQGQLDMAFDKFRKVEIDDSLMEVLYNLGLDFERKRQFNKAESVFKYMAEYNPKFRDLDARLVQSKAMSETMILGGNSGRTNASTMVLDKTSVSKPMLGRYEIDSELGKGAMGVVYLGKDPKIGRVVAIKTMALTQEFEADELKDVMERFFREAETAGRLNHPNIVTMYDAGEEHDLAYIAMEFLKGKDLAVHTKLDNLLPVPTVLSIVSRVADALAYAHSLNVVHRDIKPANIMYDAPTDTVKVTDFGIARITDSSKTKTGMVLGSPSYMSPEQLAGTKIEGASDLFSLGVSMYQLLCGKLPFYGDSMAQLMFRIASEPHVDILTVRTDLSPCIADIINKALAKNIEERYKSGAEMADAIRKCAASLQG
jgi:eukaryotic-like serine/threonine-protein kinase